MTEQVDTTAVDPREFAAQLANTPDDQLAAGMQSEARGHGARARSSSGWAST